MAGLVTIPGAYALIRELVVEDRRSQKEISDGLRRRYPTVRGLSSRSVRRFCETHDIHCTSRLSDLELDTYIRNGVARVSVDLTEHNIVLLVWQNLNHTLGWSIIWEKVDDWAFIV